MSQDTKEEKGEGGAQKPQIQASQVPINPLNKHVVLVELPKESETAYGIVLPDTQNVEEAIERGRVIAAADDCEKNLKPDDHVFYSKFIPQDLKLRIGKTEYKFFIIPEELIMATIKK